MKTKEKGELAEAKILARFLELGWPVSIPFGDNCRYDMIVEREGKLLKVQCKSAWYVENGTLHFNTCSHNSKGANRNKKRHYTSDEIDIVAVYSPHTEKCYLLSVDDLPRSTAILRIKASANGQTKDIRWAEDYEL